MGIPEKIPYRDHGSLKDSFDREFRYLRLSLTEACNMACTYCLPQGFPEWYRHKARLGLREIQIILEGFRSLGFTKVRLTGGEPTVHPQCLKAIQLARQLGYDQIAMTTNGLQIENVERWIEHGLTQINISCDTLDPNLFAEMTGSHRLQQVLSLIDQAINQRLTVKINTVLMRSKNGTRKNIVEMIQWALEKPLVLRFIELMDTGLNQSFAPNERVYGYEILKIISETFSDQPLEKAPKSLLTDGPADAFRLGNHPGQIGFINPLSCNFCSSCNRLRVTAKGRLKLCLFGDHDYELSLKSAEDLACDVTRLMEFKGERHHLDSGYIGNVETFRTIGG